MSSLQSPQRQRRKEKTCACFCRARCCAFGRFYRLALLLVYFNDNLLCMVLLFSLFSPRNGARFSIVRFKPRARLKCRGTHDGEEDVGEGLIHSGGSVHRCGWRPLASPSGLRNFHRLESTPSSRSARSAKSFKSRMISEAVVVVDAP